MAPTSDPDAQRNALIERLMQSAVGMFDIYTAYLGHRLGLYEPLATTGGCTSDELARRTGTNERHVREWLEQQAVVGVLEVDEPHLSPAERRYHLPPAHADVLVKHDNANYLAPLAQLMIGAVHPLPLILEAFHSGRGVPFGAYGPDMREGQAAFNRAALLHLLGPHWLPTIPDVHARLGSVLPARIADVGCGAGWASIGLALTYPRVRVDGFDLDPPSVTLARANASQMGVADRVHFMVRDAADVAPAEPYDLVLAFECIHDMADPVGVLRAMRTLAGERGAVLVVDEHVGESFSERNPATEPILYGFSVLHCLPVSMVDQPSAATGTVMRLGTLRGYALAASFREVTVLPIENPFYTFYRLIR
jgi:2-polyprenyl-3-methyl-5-hydroxy-6-metoxy-1,4-benzoquinol methylase